MEGAVLDWVVKLRPDIWFFAGVPPYCQLDPDREEWDFVSLQNGVACPGDILMDAPESETWEELVEIAGNRAEWRALVRSLRESNISKWKRMCRLLRERRH